MTIIEIVEMTPEKQLPDQILHSTKKAKTHIPSEKSKNDKTITTDVYNNLKCTFNKTDDEVTCFAKRY